MDNALTRINFPSKPAAVEPAARPRSEAAREAVREGASDARQGAPVQQSARSEQIVEAVSKINDFIQISRRDLQFSVDEETGMTVVKVLDAETDEVIRQIPAEEVLAIAASLEEVKGLLFKAKA